MRIPISPASLPLVKGILQDLNMHPIEAQLPIIGGIQYVDLNTDSSNEQASTITRIKTLAGAVLLTMPTLPDEMPPPIPVLSSLSPASGSHNSGLTLTAGGSNFVNGCTIYFGGKPRKTTFIDAGNLSALLVKQDISPARAYPFSVVSPRGHASGTLLFTST
jgi:IPT/TIG domain